MARLPNRRQKKSRRQGRDGGVLGVSLADELVGEGKKNTGAVDGLLGMFTQVDKDRIEVV